MCRCRMCKEKWVAVTCCAPLHLEGPVAYVSSPALIRRAPAACHRVVH